MTYLDLYRFDGAGKLVSVMYDDRTFKDFLPGQFGEVLDELRNEEQIVTYNAPPFQLMKMIGDVDEEDAEDFRSRVMDLHKLVRRASAFDIALGKLAQGTMGNIPMSEITRFSTLEYEPREYDIMRKVHDRLRVLKTLWGVVEAGIPLAFYHKGQRHVIEIEVPDADP